ncbi:MULTISPECIES: hypothetical protein [unclassified Pedobacter]|uniref:hypothetical protein n=1 Tax=unclassified Pedobacter TaxID=2628915 RepID=UPI002245FD91|nr:MULTISPECIES: hypothetical protein [unclassified Pedobacter]MCX2432339.1 hypothetical protein [Pedobacter sp. GR22-10]MCX2582871.1 hypothetical protein [Pedobacter sp. MR22-3]
MKNFKCFFCYTIWCLLVCSCTFTTSKLNDKSDQLLGEKITSDFYKAMKERNYKNSAGYFSEEFSKKTDTGKLFKFYRDYEKKTGLINRSAVVSCETKSTKEGSNIYKSFVVIYRVERSIKPTQERFILKSMGNAEPKIYRYEIDDKLK